MGNWISTMESFEEKERKLKIREITKLTEMEINKKIIESLNGKKIS